KAADRLPGFGADSKPDVRPRVQPGAARLAADFESRFREQPVLAPPLSHRAIQPLPFQLEKILIERHQIDQQAFELHSRLSWQGEKQKAPALYCTRPGPVFIGRRKPGHDYLLMMFSGMPCCDDRSCTLTRAATRCATSWKARPAGVSG